MFNGVMVTLRNNSGGVKNFWVFSDNTARDLDLKISDNNIINNFAEEYKRLVKLGYTEE